MDKTTNREETRELIKRYFEGLKSGDFSEDEFAPGVRLQTPFMESPATGEEAVLEALKGISGTVDDIKLLRLVIDGDFACAMIEFVNKDGVRVDMCDSYRIQEGKFIEIRPYFDPRPLMGG
jgi:hypothetical protein